MSHLASKCSPATGWAALVIASVALAACAEVEGARQRVDTTPSMTGRAQPSPVPDATDLLSATTQLTQPVDAHTREERGPDCRARSPMVADWCTLTGPVPAGGAVHVDGSVVPIRLRTDSESFAVQVPLGMGSDSSIVVTTFDAQGEVADEEQVVIARGERTGDVQVLVNVFGVEGDRIEGAAVTVGGRTFTTDRNGQVVVGESIWDQATATYSVEDGVAAGTDLVHVTADGHLGRLDSIGAWQIGQPVEPFRESPGYEQQVIDVTLDRIATPTTVRRGDASTVLDEAVRIVFGPDGAPANGEVSLTPGADPGSALQPFGVALFDITPFDLGPDASLRIAFGEDAPDDAANPGPVTMTLWEPTTATQRQVDAMIDPAAGELVVPLDEIRGEIVFVSREFSVVRTDHGPFGDPVDERIWSTSPPCGEAFAGDFTVAPLVEWRPTYSSDRLEQLLRRHDIVEEVQGAQPQLTIPAGHHVAEPVFLRRWLHRVEYHIVYHYSGLDAVWFAFFVLPTSESYDRVELGAAAMVSGDDEPPAVEEFEPPDDCAIVGTWRRIDYDGDSGWGPGGAYEIASVITIEAQRNAAGEIERYRYISDKPDSANFRDCEDVFVLTVHGSHPNPGDVYREALDSTTCDYFEYFIDFRYALEFVEWQMSAEGNLFRAEVGHFGVFSSEPYLGVSIWERLR